MIFICGTLWSVLLIVYGISYTLLFIKAGFSKIAWEKMQILAISAFFFVQNLSMSAFFSCIFRIFAAINDNTTGLWNSHSRPRRHRQRKRNIFHQSDEGEKRCGVVTHQRLWNWRQGNTSIVLGQPIKRKMPLASQRKAFLNRY